MPWMQSLRDYLLSSKEPFFPTAYFDVRIPASELGVLASQLRNTGLKRILVGVPAAAPEAELRFDASAWESEEKLVSVMRSYGYTVLAVRAVSD